MILGMSLKRSLIRYNETPIACDGGLKSYGNGLDTLRSSKKVTCKFIVQPFSKKGGGKVLLFTIFQFFAIFFQDGHHAKYGWPRCIQSPILCKMSIAKQNELNHFSPLAKIQKQ